MDRGLEHHPRGRPAVRVGPVAELPVRVAAPATERAVRHHRTGVMVPCRDARNVSQARDHGGGGAIGGSSVPELAEVVAAPAEHAARRDPRAGVAFTGINLDSLRRQRP